jgi:hypothetical protein
VITSPISKLKGEEGSMNYKQSFRPALIAAAITMGSVSSAFAGTLPLSYSETAVGTVVSGITTNLSVPGSYTYDHTFFTQQTPTIQGSSAAYGFYDDFVFTISGAAASSITSTIDLGNVLQITGLQARLYKPASGEQLPVHGAPSNGVTDAWSMVLAPGVGSVTVFNPNLQLSAGTYVLELRGTATGSSGGSYAGVLNLAPSPVPVPAAAWLFMSAFGGLASLRRRFAA